MNVLFVDHVCHQKTKSADFVLDVFRTRHEVRCHYYDCIYRCKVPKNLIEWADVIVYWEFLPSRFACGVPGKRCVFVPMYDNEWGSKWQWRRLAMLGMNVISFCRAVGDHARNCGVKNVLDVRFAYDPALFVGRSGDSRKVILWERGAVAFRSVKALFSPQDIDKVIVVRRDEEGITYQPISEEDQSLYHVEIKQGGFLPQDEYYALLSEPGVYIAPRYAEGIGMAFLEQMAMGKCVIAHDAPTMNEYLESGRTGILVDMRHPRRIATSEISNVRENVRQAAQDAFENWQLDKKRIVAFFDELKSMPLLRSPWSFLSIVYYLLYWLEGAMMRVRSVLVRK